MLCAHLDVVPPGEEDEWEMEPFGSGSVITDDDGKVRKTDHNRLQHRITVVSSLLSLSIYYKLYLLPAAILNNVFHGFNFSKIICYLMRNCVTLNKMLLCGTILVLHGYGIWHVIFYT